MAKLDEYIKILIKDPASFAIEKLKELIKAAKNDHVEFIQKQGKRLEKYIRQVATGKISKREFKDLIKDLASLEKINRAKISIKAKARAEKIAKGIVEIVINGLFKLIKL